MLSRRDVIIGAGALVAVGVGGVIEMGAGRRTRLLRQVGLASSPDRSVVASHTPVVSGTLDSAHMPRPVHWSLSLPPGPLSGVVYCLHGHNDDHHFAFDQIHLPDVVAAAGAKLAVASVDGGPDGYWHPRTDGSDSLAMLLDGFIPMIENRISVPGRALLGWSMGGYGALLAAETAPGRFQAVVAASPALWTSPGATAAGAFDSPDDYRRHDVFVGTTKLASITVRVDCGTGDPFYPAAKKFAGALRPPPQGSFGAGFHDAAYWRSVAPRQIDTINHALSLSSHRTN